MGLFLRASSILSSASEKRCWFITKRHGDEVKKFTPHEKMRDLVAVVTLAVNYGVN